MPIVIPKKKEVIGVSASLRVQWDGEGRRSEARAGVPLQPLECMGRRFYDQSSWLTHPVCFAALVHTPAILGF